MRFKVQNTHKNRPFLPKLTPQFWPFWGSKKSFSGLLESCFGVVQDSLRHCFWTKKAHFWVYFQLRRLINDLEKWDFLSKFDHFETSILTILGFEKVIFWTFSKLFWSCFGRIKALFLDIEGPLLGVFLAPEFEKRLRISSFFVKILLFWDLIFHHFWCQKSFSLFFKDFLELFRKCLGTFFDWNAEFWLHFKLKSFFCTFLAQDFYFGVPQSPIKHQQWLLRATSLDGWVLGWWWGVFLRQNMAGFKIGWKLF